MKLIFIETIVCIRFTAKNVRISGNLINVEYYAVEFVQKYSYKIT